MSFPNSKHFFLHYIHTQLGTADAEIKARSVEDPERSIALTLKPGVGQHLVSHA